MSLHKFAQDVASKGRGDDSLLIHMTPDEVQRLQAFAQANGRSLTINPDTGLPEAGMLSDLFKAVAPIALGAFLGPGAFGIAGMGLSAGTAGLVTGGLTTLATGSLSRGLMAGLGAYGGAGLAEGLAGTGAGILGQQASEATAMELANAGASEGLTGEAYNKAFQQSVTDKMAGANTFSAGLNAAKADPMAFAKDNFKYLGAAAAPIMAGQMVPTTTKMPEETNPAYIRQKLYDPYTQTFKSLKPVKASEWGDRNFSDAYTNPQTGIASVLDVRKPEPMAAGGIVALAGGGNVVRMAGGTPPTMLSDEELYQKTGSWEEAARLRDEQNNALNQYNWAQAAPAAAAPAAPAAPAASAYNQYTDEQIASYLSTNPNVDIQEAIKTTNADPAAVNRYLAGIDNSFRGSTDTTGGSGTLGIYNQMKAQGIDPTELYGAATAFDPKYAGWSKEDIQRGYSLDKGAYALSDQLGGKVSDKDWAKFMDDNKYSINDMAQAFGLSRNEVKARYDAAKKPPEKPITFKNPVTGGTMTAPTRTTTTVLPTDPTVNAPPGTKNPYGGPNTPGDKTYNPDGSITVTPNIPGRPYGGFSGMDEVKNAYTAGGGSLGYIPKAPKTIAEFNDMYNQQTGDSLAAYNYLMGKGGAKFPIQSVAASTGINRPYWTGAMRYKQKFLTSNPDGTVTSSETNPNAPKAKGAAGAKKAINILDNQGNTLEATLGEDGYYYTSDGNKYDSSGVQVMAQGGISGDGGLNLHIPLNFGGGGGQSGFGDYGAGTPIPMMGTFGGQNNTGTGGYGYADRPDETGGLYKGPMMPGGLDDTMTPGMMAENAANQQKNASAQAYATANPASVSDLAKGLGLFANGGMTGYAMGGGLGSLGSYSDGGRLLKGPGDGVSDSIPATIGAKRQPARLADGEFVIPARIVSELGNGSTEAGAKKLYAMMDRVQRARGKTTGKNKVAANSRADKHLPA